MMTTYQFTSWPVRTHSRVSLDRYSMDYTLRFMYLARETLLLHTVYRSCLWKK